MRAKGVKTAHASAATTCRHKSCHYKIQVKEDTNRGQPLAHFVKTCYERFGEEPDHTARSCCERHHPPQLQSVLHVDIWHHTHHHWQSSTFQHTHKGRARSTDASSTHSCSAGELQMFSKHKRERERESCGPGPLLYHTVGSTENLQPRADDQMVACKQNCAGAMTRTQLHFGSHMGCSKENRCSQGAAGSNHAVTMHELDESQQPKLSHVDTRISCSPP
jgi:hypothetical protein